MVLDDAHQLASKTTVDSLDRCGAKENIKTIVTKQRPNRSINDHWLKKEEEYTVFDVLIDLILYAPAWNDTRHKRLLYLLEEIVRVFQFDLIVRKMKKIPIYIL